MPVYTYKCEECNKKFEVRQSMTDPEIEICPECGGKVHKVISQAGVIFKGPGFYVNDNACPNADLDSADSPCHSCPNAHK